MQPFMLTLATHYGNEGQAESSLMTFSYVDKS